MKISEFIEKIEKIFPLKYSESYDNSGFNIGDTNSRINNVLVCLDVDVDAIQYAVKNNCNLIVSHHPLTFNSYKNILNDINSIRIKEVILNDINCYSIHTNFDSDFLKGMPKAFINKLNLSNKIKHIDILEKTFDNKHGIGFIITFKSKISLNNLYKFFCKKLEIDINNTQMFSKNPNDKINKIAICPGSGKGLNDLIFKNKVEAYFSSELSHNDILDLVDSNISYINLTHYGIEKVFVEYINNLLKNKFKFKVYNYYNNFM